MVEITSSTLVKTNKEGRFLNTLNSVAKDNILPDGIFRQ